MVPVLLASSISSPEQFPLSTEVKAPTKITIDAPQIELKGAVTMGGAGSSDTITLDGSIVTNGNISTSGEVRAGHFYGPVN